MTGSSRATVGSCDGPRCCATPVRRLIEHTSDVIVVVDRQGIIRYSSPSVGRALGYHAAEMVDVGALRLIHPDDATPTRRAFRTALARPGNPISLSFRCRHRDGSWRAFDAVVTNLLDDPTVMGVVGNLDDVTDQRRAEEELEKRALKAGEVALLGQRALAGAPLTEVMDDAVARVARILDVPYCSIWELLPDGQSLQARTGVGLQPGIVGRATIKATESQTGYTLASGKPVVVADLREETRFDASSLLLAHGVISGASVVILGRSRAFGVLGVQTTVPRAFSQDDINFLQSIANVIATAIERAQSEEALRASEERFRRLAENAQDVIFRYELAPAERLSYVSPAIQHVLGYRPDELYADPDLVQEIVPSDSASLFQAMIDEERFDELLTVTWRHRDGHPVWAEQRTVPIYDDEGNLIAVEGILRDVSERRRMEEQLLRAQRLEVAGRIAGQVAHDFNNLLAPLMGYPDLIKMRLPDDHPAVAYCDAMIDAARLMAQINEDLLSLGRRAYATHARLDLNGVVRTAVTHMEAFPTSLTLTLEQAPDLLPIKGSEAQLVRVVVNLLSNALEATPDGGAVTVTTENVYLDHSLARYNRVERGEYVRCAVSDNGCGIEPSILNRIFDAFFTTKTTDRRRGSGLGLSVVQTIIEDHHGYVDVQSAPGQGAAFSLYLPVCRDAVDSDSDPRLRGGTERILVVDDDAVQRTVMERLLQTLGYSVATVARGEEAVATLPRHCPDLVILDMVMPPGIDGCETYRRLRAIRPDQRAIIVSGYAETARVEEALALGASAFLRKPLTLDKLANAVREELDRQR